MPSTVNGTSNTKSTLMAAGPLYMPSIVPLSAPVPPPSAYAYLPLELRGHPLPNDAPRSLGKSLASEPDVYNGNKVKFVRWWQMIEQYLKGFSVRPNDQEKILIVLSYMRGNNAAGRFADLYVTQGLEETLTFDEFSKKLNLMFRPVALQRNVEKELLDLRQDKDATVEDYLVRMEQLILEADYDVVSHPHLLINILRHGVRNEIVEYVERSQPALLTSRSFVDWKEALVNAEEVLQDISDRQRGRSQGTILFANRTPARPISTLAISKPAPSQVTAKVDVHPNQPGTFSGDGVPMDISRARAEGKCVKCGGPWQCKTQSRPCRDARFVEFKGAKIYYQNMEGLADVLKLVEQNNSGIVYGE